LRAIRRRVKKIDAHCHNVADNRHGGWPVMSRLRVLLIGFEDWYSTARLPEMLHKSDFDIAVLSEPANFAAQSRHVAHRFGLDVPGLRRGRLESVLSAIDAFAPDLLVPGDERALRLLHFLALSPAAASRPALRPLLARSVGREGLQPIGERSRVLDLAGRLGIACPEHAPAPRLGDVLAFGDRHGWPLYLKRDHTYGGQGVRLCADAAAARAAHAEFSVGDRLWSARGVWRRGRRFVESRICGADPLALPIGTRNISVEAAVPGRPAFYAAVALEGRLLAGFAAEVEAFHPPPAGPSTRVRLSADAAMDRAAAALVEALGHSGFFGLDFIRRADGKLDFLEFNGRPTTVCHLGGLVSADLGAALSAAMKGQFASFPGPLPASGKAAAARVALFPQDWIREPHADDRNEFALDIPRDDPALLTALNRRLPASVDRAEIESLSRRAGTAKES